MKQSKFAERLRHLAQLPRGLRLLQAARAAPAERVEPDRHQVKLLEHDQASLTDRFFKAQATTWCSRSRVHQRPDRARRVRHSCRAQERHERLLTHSGRTRRSQTMVRKFVHDTDDAVARRAMAGDPAGANGPDAGINVMDRRSSTPIRTTCAGRTSTGSAPTTSRTRGWRSSGLSRCCSYLLRRLRLASWSCSGSRGDVPDRPPRARATRADRARGTGAPGDDCAHPPRARARPAAAGPVLDLPRHTRSSGDFGTSFTSTRRSGRSSASGSSERRR